MLENDIKRRVEKDFGSLAPSVAAELEMFITSFGDISGPLPGARVVRCMVHLAAGKTESLAHYIKAALGDPRDVIWWAEYDRDGKRMYDFNEPFQNV